VNLILGEAQSYLGRDHERDTLKLRFRFILRSCYQNSVWNRMEYTGGSEPLATRSGIAETNMCSFQGRVITNSARSSVKICLPF
jgi:hypothetical protein